MIIIKVNRNKINDPYYSSEIKFISESFKTLLKIGKVSNY